MTWFGTPKNGREEVVVEALPNAARVSACGSGATSAQESAADRTRDTRHPIPEEITHPAHLPHRPVLL